MWRGAPHTAKRSMINCVSMGCPLPPYIKEQGGGRPALIGHAPSRIPTRNPIPSRFPTREERGVGVISHG